MNRYQRLFIGNDKRIRNQISWLRIFGYRSWMSLPLLSYNHGLAAIGLYFFCSLIISIIWDPITIVFYTLARGSPLDAGRLYNKSMGPSMFLLTIIPLLHSLSYCFIYLGSSFNDLSYIWGDLMESMDFYRWDVCYYLQYDECSTRYYRETAHADSVFCTISHINQCIPDFWAGATMRTHSLHFESGKFSTVGYLTALWPTLVIFVLIYFRKHLLSPTLDLLLVFFLLALIALFYSWTSLDIVDVKHLLESEFSWNSSVFTNITAWTEVLTVVLIESLNTSFVSASVGMRPVKKDFTDSIYHSFLRFSLQFTFTSMASIMKMAELMYLRERSDLHRAFLDTTDRYASEAVMTWTYLLSLYANADDENLHRINLYLFNWNLAQFLCCCISLISELYALMECVDSSRFMKWFRTRVNGATKGLMSGRLVVSLVIYCWIFGINTLWYMGGTGRSAGKINESVYLILTGFVTGVLLVYLFSISAKLWEYETLGRMCYAINMTSYLTVPFVYVYATDYYDNSYTGSLVAVVYTSVIQCVAFIFALSHKFRLYRSDAISFSMGKLLVEFMCGYQWNILEHYHELIGAMANCSEINLVDGEVEEHTLPLIKHQPVIYLSFVCCCLCVAISRKVFIYILIIIPINMIFNNIAFCLQYEPHAIILGNHSISDHRNVLMGVLVFWVLFSCLFCCIVFIWPDKTVYYLCPHGPDITELNETEGMDTIKLKYVMGDMFQNDERAFGMFHIATATPFDSRDISTRVCDPSTTLQYTRNTTVIEPLHKLRGIHHRIARRKVRTVKQMKQYFKASERPNDGPLTHTDERLNQMISPRVNYTKT